MRVPGRDFMDRHRSVRILVDLVIIIAAFYVIQVVWNVLTNFGDILLLFFLAWVITFILEPVSSFLVGKKVLGRPIPRVVAVSLVYLALLLVISGLIVLAVPAVQAQVTQVAVLIQVDLSASHLQQISSSLVGILRRLGFSQTDATNLVNQAIAQIPARTHEITSQAIASASSLLSTVATGVFDASLVVILSFYMMLDGGRLTESLVLKLPPSWEPDLRLFQTYINDMFAGFFRAQLIVAGLYAAFTWAIMLAMGAGNGAFLAAFLSGVFMLLPFAGAFLAVVPPALLVLLQTPPDQLLIKLLILIILLGAAQHVVLNLLAPRIYGQHLGIDPILLFGALLLGARVGGIWGAFFAAPIVAIIYAIFETFYDRIASRHPLFQPEEAAADAVEGIAPPLLPGLDEVDEANEVPSAPRSAAPPSPARSVPGMSGIYRVSGLTTRSAPRANGTTGTNGANGANGKTGATATPPAGQPVGTGIGANGASNPNGAHGANGTNGTTSTTSTNGANGANVGRSASVARAGATTFGKVAPGVREGASSNPPGMPRDPNGTDGATAAPDAPRASGRPTASTPANAQATAPANAPANDATEQPLVCDIETVHAANELTTGRHDPPTPTEEAHPAAVGRGELAAEQDTAKDLAAKMDRADSAAVGDQVGSADHADHPDHADNPESSDVHESSGVFPWRRPHTHKRRARKS